ncbi:MAG: YbhN family protein [Rhodospirillales bacterium]
MSGMREQDVAAIGSARAMLAKMARPLVLSVAAGVAIYLASIFLGDRDQIVAAIARIGPAGWAAILGLSVANYVLRFLRWHWYIADLGTRVPMARHLCIYLAAFAFATTPGKAGEAVRSIYLLRYGVKVSNSLAAFLIERYMDLIAILILACLAAIHFEDSRWVVVLAAAASAVLYAVYRGSWVLRLLDSLARSMRREFLKKLARGIHDFQRDAGFLLRGRIFPGALAIGLVAWAAEGLGFYLTVSYLGMEAPVALMVGIYSIGILAGALSFIPGGIGSTEAVMGVLLVLVGADTATAVAATIMCRLATLWFAVLLGMSCLAGLELSGSAGLRHAQKTP